MLGRTEFLALLGDIRERPRMFVPSDHYAAIVSWIEGLNMATKGQLLSGFNDWLGTPSVAWWGQIEQRTVRPGHATEDGDLYRRLSEADSQRCVAALIDALEEFLRQTDG